MSVTSLVDSGPLLLALPVAAAAGAVTFLSPCCLPLVPGYLAYITGMSGAGARSAQASACRTADLAAPAVATVSGSGMVAAVSAPVPATPRLAGVPRGRMVAGTMLFVVGFSVVFALLGLAAGASASCCILTPPS